MFGAVRGKARDAPRIVEATINFVAQHPEALPATFNTVEFNKDAALRALHSDLYAETLDVYAYAKAANRAGAYDDYINTIKTRFFTGPRKKQTPATP